MQGVPAEEYVGQEVNVRITNMDEVSCLAGMQPQHVQAKHCWRVEPCTGPVDGG